MVYGHVAPMQVKDSARNTLVQLFPINYRLKKFGYGYYVIFSHILDNGFAQIYTKRSNSTKQTYWSKKPKWVNAAVIHLLILLLAGDIQLNPGPIGPPTLGQTTNSPKLLKETLYSQLTDLRRTEGVEYARRCVPESACVEMVLGSSKLEWEHGETDCAVVPGDADRVVLGTGVAVRGTLIAQLPLDDVDFSRCIGHPSACEPVDRWSHRCLATAGASQGFPSSFPIEPDLKSKSKLSSKSNRNCAAVIKQMQNSFFQTVNHGHLGP